MDARMREDDINDHDWAAAIDKIEAAETIRKLKEEIVTLKRQLENVRAQPPPPPPPPLPLPSSSSTPPTPSPLPPLPPSPLPPPPSPPATGPSQSDPPAKQKSPRWQRAGQNRYWPRRRGYGGGRGETKHFYFKF